MKIIVAGGRNFRGTNAHENWLTMTLFGCKISELVCGMARGADMYGFDWARKNNIPVKEFSADWEKLGRGAGPARNIEMGKYADMLVAFPGGTGTAHMVKTMLIYKKPVIQWPFISPTDAPGS